MIYTIDDWMLATDDERAKTKKTWNIKNDDGKEIANYIASIFINECVYDISDPRASIINDTWVIETFADDDHYDALKNRKNITFLGFDVVFNHIDKLNPG